MMIVRPEDLHKLHDPVSAQTELQRVETVRRIDRRQSFLAAENTARDSRWYVLKVKNRCELSVEKELAEKNIAAFVPLVKTGSRRKRFRKSAVTTMPAFLGYAFANVPSTGDAFAALLRLDAVEYLCGTHTGPTPLSGKNLKEFSALYERGLLDADAPLDKTQWVKPGEIGRIKSGPFAMTRALVQAYRGRNPDECIAVMLDTKFKMVVRIDSLEKCG